MKKCDNGHYYTEELEFCPYCPTSKEKKNTSKEPPTELFNEKKESLNVDKTVVFGEGNANNNPERTKPFIENQNQNDNFDKTMIVEDANDDIGVPSTRAKRKMVGWLVSYTIDEMGIDFRIYEGKNVIGSKSSCEIAVFQDQSVSSTHATILFRNNKFRLKDEFSTNGTSLNNEIVEDETPTLKDGDIIKVGNTTFKFKIAI